VKDGSHELASLSHMSLRQAYTLQCRLEMIKSLAIIIKATVWATTGSTLTQVSICSFVKEMQMLPFLWRRTRNKIIENVKVSLARWWTRNSVPFKVVIEGFDTT
jgi:hypothetical protein